MKIPKIKLIFDRKHQATEVTKGAVDLRVTYKSVQKYIYTGVKCNTTQWDNETESIINSIEATELNETLIRMKMQALHIINNMIDEGEIDINRIPLLIKSRAVELTFLQYIHTRMIRKNVTENTKKAYHTFYAKFSEWGVIKLFSDITEANIRN